MARPCKIPTDPELYAKLLEHLALGLPQVLIARALEIPENTLSQWKKRKDFGRDLALKKLEILGKPLQDMANRFPKDFVERHPDTRDDFAPPTQSITQDITMAGKKAQDLSDDDLASMVGNGKGKPQEAATGHEKQPEAHQISQVKGDEEGPKVVH